MIADLPLTVRYALAACVCLARCHPTRRPARSIAEETGVPPAFLAKILRQLASEGLIDGERGHRGGYRLARPPTQVVLADVMEAVDPGDGATSVCSMGDRRCDGLEPCAMHELWSVATAPIKQLSCSVSLQRLAQISDGPRVA